MKKIISILLTIAIMCSFTVFAFAADSDVELDTTYTYTISKDKTIDLTFVPSETAIYKIDFEFKDIQAVKNSFPELTLYYKADDIAAMSLSKFDSEVIDSFPILKNFVAFENNFTFVGEKNKPYTIELSNDCMWDMIESYVTFDKTVDVTFKVTNTNAQELKIDNTYNQNDASAVYYMQPEKDVVLNFTSSNNTMCLDIYNINNVPCGSFYAYEEAFNYVVKLDGGNFYKIEISSSDETKVPFSFTIKDGSNILPKEIYSDSEDIYILKGEEWYIDIYTKPYGSAVNSEGFEVTVANEKIAKVEIDEDGYYVISGLKAGKTTYTIKDKTTGISATYNIEVLSRVAYFFASIPYNIASFFMVIFYPILNFFGIIDY